MYHVEYAPDGRTFVTAGQDRTARIWDAETGQERLVLRGHEDEVDFASFDPSGTLVVTAGDDATVRIWSVADGRELRVLDRLASPTVNAQFTPDGRDVIAAARDGTLVRWDVATGRRRAAATGQRRAGHRKGRPVDENWVETMAISAQGMTLALAGRDAPIQLFDFSHDGLAAITRPTAIMDTNGFCVAFAPDGRSLAATASNGVLASQYDTMSGKTQVVLEGPVDPTACTLAFAPDGRTLAVGDGRGAVRIWDLDTRSSQVSLLGHTGGIWCVAFAPNGRTLATTGRDGTIRLWDARRRSDRAVFRGLARIPMHPFNRWSASSVAFSADGTQLLAANDPGCVLACNLRDATTQTLRTADLAKHETGARLAPDGGALAVSELIAAAPGTKHEDWRWKTVIYDLSGRRQPITLPGLWHSWASQWSPDGRRLVLVESTGDLTLWDGATGRLLGRAAAGFGDGSSWPAFLPAGDGLIAICGDQRFTSRPFELVVWNPAPSQLDRRPIPTEGNGGPLGKSSWPPMVGTWRTLRAPAPPVGSRDASECDSCSSVTATRCTTWPSRPMAAPWPRRASTRPCGSGASPAARSCWCWTGTSVRSAPSSFRRMAGC